jgi:hypothetical protein
MTPHEFILWFKGFTQAASDYTLTPHQWDIVKDQLDKVHPEDKKSTSWSISYGKLSDTTYKQDELSTNTIF